MRLPRGPVLQPCVVSALRGVSPAWCQPCVVSALRVEDLERLGQVTFGQTAQGRRSGEPAPDALLQVVRVAGLALMRAQRSDLPAERGRHVDEMGGRRGTGDPDLADLPWGQALALAELGEAKGLRASGYTASRAAEPTARWSGWLAPMRA